MTAMKQHLSVTWSPSLKILGSQQRFRKQVLANMLCFCTYAVPEMAVLVKSLGGSMCHRQQDLQPLQHLGPPQLPPDCALDQCYREPHAFSVVTEEANTAFKEM